MSRDYAIGPAPVHAPHASLMVHRVDCPLVRAQAEAGEPVMTLMGCAREPDPKLPRCECLHSHRDDQGGLRGATKT
jgi:hypothetical protein